MTFSVVASAGERHGVAVASKFLAVGAVVPAARALVGAIATQAAANLRYRCDGLTLLAGGEAAGVALRRLVEADPEREGRQVGMVDRFGRSATYTGHACQSWAGGLHGPGYAMQGNLLAGPQVLDAMLAAYLKSDAPLPERLITCLAAGEEAGGDRRGRQSAALLVVSPAGGYGGGSDVEVDLRVDDHPEPVSELKRLLDLHQLYFTPSDPASWLPLEGELAGEVATLLATAGYPPRDDAELTTALRAWAGVQNLEERCARSGFIDPVVLAALRTGSPH
ncbi:MAG: DUF1028 domain-containing protein [Mycobacteriales bacterium]